jgi:membrane dipeptidase
MIPIFDGHNDTLLHLYEQKRGEHVGFFDRSDKGHIDYPRAIEGGFAGGFFAIYSYDQRLKAEVKPVKIDQVYEYPLSPPRDRSGALDDTLAMAALLFKIERESAGKFKVVRTVAELKHCLDHQIMAAIFHIEGAEAIDSNLDTLEVLYQSGLRSLGPVWSRQNVFGSGVPFSFPRSPNTGDGLTPYGKDLVRRCNALGIMLDLSHMTEKGFWDVAKLSTKPLVATHSNAHVLSRTPRNLTNKQLAAIRESDGMVGLNFAVGFLRKDGGRGTDVPLETMVQHIDHLVEKLGIDRVGLGSDFDGAGIPDAIKDVSGLPNLIKALRKHGYGNKELKKIGYQNWVRVLGKTWG